MSSTATPLRAALYLRVSTGEQTTDNQLAPLRAEAERRGWLLVPTVYRDEGISGSKGRDKRSGLDTLLKDAARGKFEVVMVWSMDRLGRSVSDLIGVAADLEKSRCALFFLKDNIDTTNAAGMLFFHILASLAQFERSRTIERVHAGLDRARAAGKRLGRPPIDPDTKSRIISLLGEGIGVNAIAKRLRTGSGTVRRVAADIRKPIELNA